MTSTILNKTVEATYNILHINTFSNYVFNLSGLTHYGYMVIVTLLRTLILIITAISSAFYGSLKYVHCSIKKIFEIPIKICHKVMVSTSSSCINLVIKLKDLFCSLSELLICR